MEPAETPQRDAPVTVFLIRHGHTDAIGRTLVGRRPGVHLTSEGRAQAARLVERLRRYTPAIDALYVSPLERTRETAAPIGDAFAVELTTCEPLIEVDVGRWSGMTFDELERDGAWRRFNEHRATAGVPGGERAIDVQARTVAALDRIRAAHPGGRIAVVSHADVIRVAVLHCLGAPLDFVHRIEVAPASISAIQIAPALERVLFLNDQDD